MFFSTAHGIRLKNKTLINLTKVLFISFAVIGYFIITMTTAECGNEKSGDNTTRLRELVWDMFQHLDENQVHELGRRLQFEGPEYTRLWPPQVDVAERPHNPWASVVLFAALSAAVFLVSYYHREIIDTLFQVGHDMARDVPHHLVHSIRFTHDMVRPLVERDPQRALTIMRDIIANSAHA